MSQAAKLVTACSERPLACDAAVVKQSKATPSTCPPARPLACPRCSGASPDARFRGRTAAEVAEANGFPDTASLIRLHMMEHQQGSLESGGGGADVPAPPATVDSGAAGLDVRCAGQALVGWINVAAAAAVAWVPITTGIHVC